MDGEDFFEMLMQSGNRTDLMIMEKGAPMVQHSIT